MSAFFELMYTLLLSPLEFLMAGCLRLAFWLSSNYGLAVIILSILVNLLMLPLYRLAERWKSEEKTLRKKMDWELKSIQAHSRGWERFYYRKEVYRRYGYHPLSSLKISFGFLIQIPFFFAAYHLLSTFEPWNGHGFLLIEDLSLADGLMAVGALEVNLLPILMTLINLIAVQRHSKVLDLTEKIQLWVLAAVFLVVLYGSPSGLVLYWTVNNVFSLFRSYSGSQRLDQTDSKLWVRGGVVVALTIFLILVSDRFLNTRLVDSPARLALIALMAVSVLPFATSLLQKFSLLERIPNRAWLYIVSSGLICWMIFINNPLELYLSMDQKGGPLSAIMPSLLIWYFQSMLLAMTVYGLASQSGRRLLTIISFFLATSGMIYMAVFDVGLLDHFILHDPGRLKLIYSSILVEAIALSILIVLSLLLVTHYYRAMVWLGGAVLVSAVLHSGWNYLDARVADYAQVPALPEISPGLMAGEYQLGDEAKQFLEFSNQRNVLVFVLDGFPGSLMQRIQKQSAEALAEFDGFIWYPNALANATNTVGSVPAMVGGLRYTPTAINSRNATSLADEWADAFKVLPESFAPMNYRLKYLVPDFPHGCERLEKIAECGNLTPFGDFHYLKFVDQQIADSRVNTAAMLTMISVFKWLPHSLRGLVYNNGYWLGVNRSNARFMTAFKFKLGDWGFLSALEKHGSVVDSINTFKFYHMQVPHPPNAIAADCTLQLQTRPHYPGDDSAFFQESSCALRLLGRFFSWLKTHGLYDQSKIVIASDHGWNLESRQIAGQLKFDVVSDNQRQFRNGRLQSLLLVKDFGAKGELATSNTFLSNADIPAILCAAIGSCPGIGPDPTAVPEKGRTRITSLIGYPKNEHEEKGYEIFASFEVTDSIFNPENWRRLD